MSNTSPRTLGVPVKSVNWVRVFAGARENGEPLILTVMGQDNGGLFVCDVDPQTGHCTQYSVGLQHASFPTAVCFSAGTATLYVGSAYTGHLHRYNANLPEEERTLEDLGAIHPELCGFPCGIDEAPDGSIYIGAHPGCSLTRFDPATGAFTRFGRMDEDEMYFYAFCGADGTIAGLAKTTEPHMVVLDGETGKPRNTGPRVSTEKGEEIKVQKGVDGLLYILSSHGNFVVQDGHATAIEKVAPPMAASALPDGSAVEFTDGHINGYRKLLLTSPGGQTRTLDLDWQGNGTSLFLVHDGPDGKIYGSSMLPEHLFVCDADGANMRDLGACSEAIGEAYSMANYEGKIYIASYPGTRLSIYDPALPYDFGCSENSNPRNVGRFDEVSCRPRAILAGPAGKIWIGSYPDYGLLGGTLVSYHPDTGQSRSFRHIIPHCSVTALEWLPELQQILVGTSIIGGNGTKPKATQAPFALWDPNTGEVVTTTDFGLEVNHAILDIKYAGDGAVYAVIICDTLEPDDTHTLQPSLVLIDAVNRRVLDRSIIAKPDWPIEVSLRPGPDGAIYGCTSASFYRIRPSTAQREILWDIPYEQSEDHIHAPGPIVGNTFYFGSGHRLRALDF